jgi:hypothetical protein
MGGGKRGATAAGAYNVRLKKMPFTDSRASRNLQAIAISHCVIRGQAPDRRARYHARTHNGQRDQHCAPAPHVKDHRASPI